MSNKSRIETYERNINIIKEEQNRKIELNDKIDRRINIVHMKNIELYDSKITQRTILLRGKKKGYPKSDLETIKNIFNKINSNDIENISEDDIFKVYKLDLFLRDEAAYINQSPNSWPDTFVDNILGKDDKSVGGKN